MPHASCFLVHNRHPPVNIKLSGEKSAGVHDLALRRLCVLPFRDSLAGLDDQHRQIDF